MTAVDGDWESYWDAKEAVATDIEARALAWAPRRIGPN